MTFAWILTSPYDLHLLSMLAYTVQYQFVSESTIYSTKSTIRTEQVPELVYYVPCAIKYSN